MNRSDQWTVLHEPRKAYDEEQYRRNPHHLPARVRTDFSRDYYGEVNSRLRFWFDEVPVDKRGVIFRDPRDVVLSIANLGFPEVKTLEVVEEFATYYRQFHAWTADPGVLSISFARMTQEVDYTQQILHEFGIHDVEVSRSMILEKRNATRVKRYGTFEQLPSKVKTRFRQLTWGRA